MHKETDHFVKLEGKFRGRLFLYPFGILSILVFPFVLFTFAIWLANDEPKWDQLGYKEHYHTVPAIVTNFSKIKTYGSHELYGADWEVQYRYVSPLNGDTLTGYNYTYTEKLGQKPPYSSSPKSANVRVHKVNHHISKLEHPNYYSEDESPSAALWIICLITFLILFFIALSKLNSKLGILERGILTKGKRYRDVKYEGENDQISYTLYFEYPAANGKSYRSSVHTQNFKKLQDDDFEDLLYDPKHPYKFLALDIQKPWIKDWIKKNKKFI